MRRGWISSGRATPAPRAVVARGPAPAVARAPASGRRAALAVAAALVAALLPAAASARPAFGELVKTARALDELRLEEGRSLVAALRRDHPDEPEVRALAAQLAFLDGRYQDAAGLLRGVDRARARRVVGDLATLVDKTIATTAGYARRESPSGRFVISYPRGKDEILVDLAIETLEASWREIGADLGYHPAEPLRVELLSRSSDLARVSTLTEKDIETSGTIALCKYNKLMIVSPRATVFGYPWLDTLAHEYTHYVVMRATGDRVPIWLHEGLAKFQETRWRGPPGTGGLGRSAEHLLALALRRRRLITFEEMHPSMALLPSQEAAATAFAEVYTMVAWLQRQVGYEGIRAILAKIRDGRSERRAIAEVLGRPWEKVEAGWRRHLRTLDLRVDAGLVGDRVERVRFEKRGEEAGEEENVGLDLVGEERARRFARLGGLLRARGHLAAAAAEYEKARAIAPSDEFVGSKLARTYLELGEAQRAVDVARPLAERDPEDAGPQATLGVAYLKLGRHADAVDHLLAAVRVSPFDPEVRCGLAEALAARGDEAAAAREREACSTLRRGR